MFFGSTVLFAGFCLFFYFLSVIPKLLGLWIKNRIHFHFQKKKNPPFYIQNGAKEANSCFMSLHTAAILWWQFSNVTTAKFAHIMQFIFSVLLKFSTMSITNSIFQRLSVSTFIIGTYTDISNVICMIYLHVKWTFHFLHVRIWRMFNIFFHGYFFIRQVS